MFRFFRGGVQINMESESQDNQSTFSHDLKGDMSFVGPRLERPEIAAKYEKELPEFHLRLQAKCGLTGYAQVFGKYNTTPYDKLQMDLMYIANTSLTQDLRIIFATIKILFMKESTIHRKYIGLSLHFFLRELAESTKKSKALA